MDIFITVFLLAYSLPSLQSAPIPNPGNSVQSICAKAPKPDDCVKKINADPRSDLKTTPEGIATILYEQAKQSVPETIKFIKQSLKTVKDPTVKDQMKGCLQAYKTAGKDIKIKTNKLNKPDYRSEAVDKLTTAEQDISYDCEWEALPNRPPEVNQMSEKVHDLSNSIDAVTAILGSP